MGMHAITGMPPIIIIMGIPMLIIFIMASQRSRIISRVTPSAGIILQVMPSLPISMVMRHAIGMPVPDIMLGIIPIMGIIPDIMFGIIPIMGIMLGIIPDVIGICMAGIMAVFSILLPMSDRNTPPVARRENEIYTFRPVQQTSW